MQQKANKLENIQGNPRPSTPQVAEDINIIYILVKEMLLVNTVCVLGSQIAYLC